MVLPHCFAIDTTKLNHCMAHRLQLTVNDAVDTVNFVSHFRIFIDSVYKTYSMSPKNQKELETVAQQLSVELLKVRKVFDTRWVFSSFLAMRVIWQDFPALHQHFINCSQDQTRLSKERSKYQGLATKIKHGFFWQKLQCLKMPSLF